MTDNNVTTLPAASGFEVSAGQAQTMYNHVIASGVPKEQADAMLAATVGHEAADNQAVAMYSPDHPVPVPSTDSLPTDLTARLHAAGLTPAADAMQYDFPALTDGEYTADVHAFDSKARTWLLSAGMSREHGSAIAAGAAEIAPNWRTMSDAEQTLYTEQSRAQLQRAGIGPEQLALGKRLVQALDAKHGGAVGKYLSATGAGSHPMVVSLLVQQAQLIFGAGNGGKS